MLSIFKRKKPHLFVARFIRLRIVQYVNINFIGRLIHSYQKTKVKMNVRNILMSTILMMKLNNLEYFLKCIII